MVRIVALLVLAACGSDSDPGDSAGGDGDSAVGDAGETLDSMAVDAATDSTTHQPPDLPIVTSYGFDDEPELITMGPVGNIYAWGDSGWTTAEWHDSHRGGFRSEQSDAVVSGPFVMEQVYPDTVFGDGPGGATFSFEPALEEFYICWSVKWDADFDHNEVSEKWLFMNLNRASDVQLFQLEFGNEALHYIPEASGHEALRANMVAEAPPIDGEWVLYELYFDVPTGTVRWWTNGELHAEHTGRPIFPLQELSINGTWGGGGGKVGTHSRYTDHILIAGR